MKIVPLDVFTLNKIYRENKFEYKIKCQINSLSIQNLCEMKFMSNEFVVNDSYNNIIYVKEHVKCQVK